MMASEKIGSQIKGLGIRKSALATKFLEQAEEKKDANTGPLQPFSLSLL